MIAKTKLLLLFITLAVLNTGCSIPVKPDTHKNIWGETNNFVENEFFTAEILPHHCIYGGCKAFKLTVKNKTSKNLELNWNKTLYIFNGQTLNGFMIDGTQYSKRNDPRPPNIIFPNSELSKAIWPNSLVEYENSDWHDNYMELGENGVYLTIISNGKEISEKLTMEYLRVRK